MSPGDSDQHGADGHPEVSIVIPTLNRWDELARRGLRAALIQEGVSLEVIVVDDGSAAPAPEAPPFDDPRLTLIRHEANAGVAAARNTGIRAAKGAWIAFLDDDDMWAPAKLASVLRAVDQAGADFGYSSALIVDGALSPLFVYPAVPGSELRDALRGHNAVPASASSVVARASVLTRSGIFDENFSTIADWELWIRLAGAGRGEAVNEPLVAYRASSWILKDEPRHREELDLLVAKHPEVSLDWPAYERWVAHSRAASEAPPAGRLRKLVRRARLGPTPDWMSLYQ